MSTQNSTPQPERVGNLTIRNLANGEGLVMIEDGHPDTGFYLDYSVLRAGGKTRDAEIRHYAESPLALAFARAMGLAIPLEAFTFAEPAAAAITEADAEAFAAELDQLPSAEEPVLADWERELLGMEPSTPAEPAPAAPAKRFTAREVTAPEAGYFVTDAQGDGTTGAFYDSASMRFFGLPIESILDDLETGDVPFSRLTHTATSAYTFADAEPVAEEPSAPLAIEGRYVLRYYDGTFGDRHFGILDVVEQRFADFDFIAHDDEPADTLTEVLAKDDPASFYAWEPASDYALSEHLVEPAPEPVVEDRYVLRYRPADGGLVVLDRELRRSAGFGYFSDGHESLTLERVRANPESVVWRSDDDLPVDSLGETREEALASVRVEEPVAEEPAAPEETTAPRYALAQAIDGYTLITDAENPEEVADWAPAIADLAPEWVEGLNDGSRSRGGLGWVPVDRHPVATPVAEPAELDDLADAAPGFYTDDDGDLWVVPGDGERPSILTDGTSSAVGMYDDLSPAGCGPFVRVKFVPEVDA